MKLSHVAAAIAVPAALIVSGCGVTHAGAVAALRPVTQSATPQSTSLHSGATTSIRATTASHVAKASPPVDPSVRWLESAGGQAEVTFNDDVDNVAEALEIESGSPTVANHLAFESAARVMRTEARKILSTPALLPTVQRTAYVHMLKDFVVVANLLQPGPGYGTTAQDYTAWYAAQRASNIDPS